MIEIIRTVYFNDGGRFCTGNVFIDLNNVSLYDANPASCEEKFAGERRATCNDVT